MTNEINVSLANMPTTIRSYVVSCKDGSYSIIINANICHEAQLMAYKHELDHIKNGDYEKKSNIDIIEINAHGQVKFR